jgi:hypothetical protein
MKLASLLAGVAIVAMTATSAAASGPIYKGSVTTNGTIFGFPVSVTSNNTGLVALADAFNPGINSSTALITISSAGFAANTAATTTTNGATFSLTGNVSADCAYFIGNASTTVDFGTIGINTSDNNPGAAFEMVGGSRTLDIDTNLAGCNTKNNVTITKANMTNTDGSGFDAAQFTDTLPFSIAATFTAGAVGAEANATQQNIGLGENASSTGAMPYGAWKSPLNMRLTIANPGKALLAGTYNGSVGVTIQAF